MAAPSTSDFAFGKPLSLPRHRRHGAWILAALLALGCTGFIDGAGGADASGTAPLGNAAGASSSGAVSGIGGVAVGPDGCEVTSAPAAPLRRLTRWEYDNTVADLLGDESHPAQRFVAEADQFGFDNNAAGAVLSPVVVEQFEEAAGVLAKQATAQMPKLLGCDSSAQGEDVCANQFIDAFFRRAYRRALSPPERSRIHDFYRQAKLDSGFEQAISVLVSAALQSPKFLYRLEFGMPAPGTTGAVRLSSWELASRLSYLLTGSMPDDELLGAAEQNLLATSEQVLAQAARLLTSDRGARVVKNFYRQWAGLNDLTDLQRKDASYSAATAQLLAQETETFVDQVIRAGDGTLSTLLTAPYSYMNRDLATFYGMQGPTDERFVKVALDPQRYSGLMTQAGLMARLAHPGQPSPVLRGKFIREKLLCAPLPPPPNNVDATLPPLDPQATARQQLTQKTGGSPCNTCHTLLNPPGFAFEHFDELGRFRANDHGLALDASGDLTGTDADGPFADHLDLLKLLTQSEQVRACVVVNWFRYAYGRDQAEADACSTQQLSRAFESSGGNVKQLLLALTQTPAFMYRTATAPGVQP